MLSVVVRGHDEQRLMELSRAIQSLAYCNYPNLDVVLVWQTAGEVPNSIYDCVRSATDGCTGRQVRVIRVKVPKGSDGRAEAANVGVDNAAGRYLAFLDFDDVVYPTAYKALVERSRATGRAITVGQIRTVAAFRHSTYMEYIGTLPGFFPPEMGLEELFIRNHVPIHSYVVDRERAEVPRFPHGQRLEEDYEFLLRMAARTPIDFHPRKQGLIVGDYVRQLNDMNTLNTIAEREGHEQVRREYLKVKARQRRLKAELILSHEVQGTLGIWPPVENLSVASLASALSTKS